MVVCMFCDYRCTLADSRETSHSNLADSFSKTSTSLRPLVNSTRGAEGAGNMVNKHVQHSTTTTPQSAVRALRWTSRKQEVLKSFALQVYILASSVVQSRIMRALLRPSTVISCFLVLRISCPSLNQLTSAFSLDTSHSRVAVASSSTVWSSRGLLNSTGGSAHTDLYVKLLLLKYVFSVNDCFQQRCWDVCEVHHFDDNWFQ